MHSAKRMRIGGKEEIWLPPDFCEQLEQNSFCVIKLRSEDTVRVSEMHSHLDVGCLAFHP